MRRITAGSSNRFHNAPFSTTQEFREFWCRAGLLAKGSPSKPARLFNWRFVEVATADAPRDRGRGLHGGQDAAADEAMIFIFSPHCQQVKGSTS